MIHSDIQAAINAQINQEHAAAFSYLGMCAYFEYENLAGFAQWCRIQYEEEVSHAMRLFQYLLDRGGRVKLEAIEMPRSEYDTPLEVFRTALAHEEHNTLSINNLYKLASQHNDHATISHLQWFLDEQVEEEKLVGEVVALVERAGDDANAILYLNDRLGDRPAEEPPSQDK